MHIFFLFVLVCFAAGSGLSSAVLSHAPAFQTFQNGQQELDRKSKFALFEDIKVAACRIPKAVIRSVGDGAKTFITSSSILVPVSLALNIKKMRPIDAWLWSGIQRGTHWAQTSAVFVGTETFITTLRDKQDNLNAQLASGVSSAVVRLNEGPVGVAKGFCIGFGLMCALDRVMPRSYSPSGRRLSRWGLSSASSSTPSTTSVVSSAAPAADNTCDARARGGAGSGLLKSTAPTQGTSQGVVDAICSKQQPPKSLSPKGLLSSLKLRK